MATPSHRPRLWAIVLFALLGTVSIAWSSFSWATSDPADLMAFSSGRSLSLPGWAWVVLGSVCGVALLFVAAWAERRRRRRPSIAERRREG